MGAPIAITVFPTPRLSLKQLQIACTEAYQEIARIEALLSIYRPDSEISRFNQSDDNALIPLCQETFDVLSTALTYARESLGAYDPTLHALIQLWKKYADGKTLPHPREIQLCKSQTGFQNVVLQQGGAKRRVAGLGFDLGGIGKGYAIDCAVTRLKAAGIREGIVHCGSTTVIWGREEIVAIRHPRQPDRIVCRIPLKDAALSTSGDDERYFEAEGQRWGHVIDPRSGYPASVAWRASVIAPTAMAADALSTAVFVAGDVDNLPQWAHGWVMTAKGEISASRGWTETLQKTTRRHFLAMTASFLLAWLWPRGAYPATVYLTKEEALQMMMPEADRFETQNIHLSDAQRDTAQQKTGKQFQESDFQFYVGRRAEQIIGYATVLEVIGKERPITFLIGLAPEGAILGLEVLIYRESQGAQVRFLGFTRQFLGKTLQDPLRLGSDIAPISGATLSSRAAAYAVRKAMALFSVLDRPQ